MKNLIKIEAKKFFSKNPNIPLKNFDDPISEIISLYDFDAKKVWVVSEYGEDIEYPDTLYVDVGKTVKTDLLIAICNLKPDECSFSDDGKSIRLWWD